LHNVVSSTPCIERDSIFDLTTSVDNIFNAFFAKKKDKLCKMILEAPRSVGIDMLVLCLVWHTYIISDRGKHFRNWE
jgi:hypothetical protein